jgi:hypothetical protein
MDWSAIQRYGPKQYDWATYDVLVRQARLNQLHVLAIITYTPAWARHVMSSSDKCEPDVKKFSLFAAKVVSRYSRMGVHHWEVWNEPNLGRFWQPFPDPRYYAKLLKLTYCRIKRVDHAAVVLVGGMAACVSNESNVSPVEFLQRLYANGAKGSFDAVGVHPYTYPLLPFSAGSSNPWMQLSELHRLMAKKGDGHKRLWITEYGAPTNGPGQASTTGAPDDGQVCDHVSEELQATMLRRAASLCEADAWIGPFFWYTFQDTGVSSTDKENFFGLVRYDGSKKPAYAIFQSIVDESE